MKCLMKLKPTKRSGLNETSRGETTVKVAEEKTLPVAAIVVVIAAVVAVQSRRWI
jgi:hypothetical protein